MLLKCTFHANARAARRVGAHRGSPRVGCTERVPSRIVEGVIARH
jgi:hypothetical protein